jgi:hypothetical protein
MAERTIREKAEGWEKPRPTTFGSDWIGERKDGLGLRRICIGMGNWGEVVDSNCNRIAVVNRDTGEYTPM